MVVWFNFKARFTACFFSVLWLCPPICRKLKIVLGMVPSPIGKVRTRGQMTFSLQTHFAYFKGRVLGENNPVSLNNIKWQ